MIDAQSLRKMELKKERDSVDTGKGGSYIFTSKKFDENRAWLIKISRARQCSLINSTNRYSAIQQKSQESQLLGTVPIRPPSTSHTAPLTYAPARLARKRIVPAMSYSILIYNHDQKRLTRTSCVPTLRNGTAAAKAFGSSLKLGVGDVVMSSVS